MTLFLFFTNGPTSASFSFIFGLFKQTIQFLQQINVKKCPSSKWRWDLNPQPFAHESSLITTKPGLPPHITCQTKLTKRSFLSFVGTPKHFYVLYTLQLIIFPSMGFEPRVALTEITSDYSAIQPPPLVLSEPTKVLQCTITHTISLLQWVQTTSHADMVYDDVTHVVVQQILEQ